MPRLDAMPVAAARLSIVLLAILSPLLLLSCGDDGKPAPKDGRYENKKVRYSFEYPREWGDVTNVIIHTAEGAEVVDSVAVGRQDPDTGALNGVQVTVTRVNQEVKRDRLEEALAELDDVFDQLARKYSGRVVRRESVELGGLSARMYTIQFTLLGPVIAELASVQTATFFGDRQYTVNCQSRVDTFNAEVLAGCEQVLQSFRFK